jgi:hypothetical protein
MSIIGHRKMAALILAGGLLCAAPALAAPEEIQVYMDEMNRPGGLGLDLHINEVSDGRTKQDYPGEQASGGRWRFTPEFSFGLTPNLELGAYLPLTTLDREGNLGVDGVKGRIKFLAPRQAHQAWFWGVNFELGKVAKKLDVNPWNAELKGILGVHKGPWTVATNLNIDWEVSGPEHTPVQYQVATKVGYAVDKDLSVGVESYNDLGTARRFGRFARQDQQLFFVADKSFGRWDLNLGVGRGFGQPEDHWTFKLIVGVPIGNE